MNSNISALALAQVGDAVFELFVREKLVPKFPTAAKLHRERVKYVNAARQSEFWAKIEPILTEPERDTARRAKNAKPYNVPKAVSAKVYAEATALEALLGWLRLRGENSRIAEILELCFDEEQ